MATFVLLTCGQCGAALRGAKPLDLATTTISRRCPTCGATWIGQQVPVAANQTEATVQIEWTQEGGTR